MAASLVGDSFFGLNLNQIKANVSSFRKRISKRILLIDFELDSVTLAEFRIHDDALDIDHVRRYALPEDALERGIPTEPVRMGSLIKDYCREQGVPAHRAAVVIPPDAVFTTRVQLPADLDPAHALAHVLDPSQGVQVPIQLQQTDVDLVPLDLPGQQAGLRDYFLVALAHKFTDRLLETLRRAELEVLRVQMGVIAQLQPVTSLMLRLQSNEVILHVELLRTYSSVAIVTARGPLKLARLTAIREFPEPISEDSDIPSGAVALNTEQDIIASDRYLPLSELDLRRFAVEIKQLMQDSQLQFPWLQWRSVVLAGPNSAHPMLANLLEEAVGLPVQLSRPLSATGVAAVQLDQPIVQQSLGRLVGLGLGFLDRQPDEDEFPDAQPETHLRHVAASIPLLTAQVAEESEDEIVFAFDRDEESSINDLASNASLVQASENQNNVAKEAVKSEDQPLSALSFALTLEEAPEEPLSEPLPERLAIEDRIVEESVPFSLDDLFSSYEAHQSVEPVQSLPEQSPVALAPEVGASANDGSVDENVFQSHLIDDPSSWPSVAKPKEPD
jgi:Tfp pilus assembly PilM family ATPase